MKKTIDKGLTCMRIRELCYEKNITVQMICDYMNLSKQTVYSWLSGKKIPSLDHLIELADILNVSVDDLLVTKFY